MSKQVLTSVKLNEQLFDDFKVLAIRTKINFQKLAERSVWLYINDEEFRNKLHNTTETEMLK
jgi:hypothetical protein